MSTENSIPGPILYLHEYESVPEDILRWKNDEDLVPWCEDVYPPSDMSRPDMAKQDMTEPNMSYPDMHERVDDRTGGVSAFPPLTPLLCAGIGTYKTRKDGEIYLCALIDPVSGSVAGWSMGVYRSAELVDRALARFFASCGQRMSDAAEPVVIRSSRNAVYKTKTYRDILAKYPVRGELTEKGTRGGVMAVSTFFSRLMIRKGGYQFADWQDAVEWIGRYLNLYNRYYGKFPSGN